MSTNQLRRYLDLLNEADLVPPNTNTALPSSGTFSNDDALAAALAQQNSEPRCAFCGTPQSQHQNLQHQFQSGGAADRPAPVPQGPVGGDDNLSRISRVKDLQRALLAAGADLGKTGAGRNGIDGDIGPLTRAAMRKYPDIAAKYADLPAGQDATPGNTAQLNAALSAIEGILAKYKVKLSEARDPRSSLLEAGPTALTPAQQAAQRAGMGMPSLVGAGPYATQAAQTAGTGAATTATNTAAKGALRGAAGIAGKAAGKALPGVGLTLGAYDAYERAKEGDYLGAGISGLAGLAALLPVAGTAVSLGLTGVNVYRDLNKNPTVAITPADAAVITQNLKVIQDWQKDPANQAALTPELKNRIENIIKGVAAVGVPTDQAATPATPTQPATAPAANPKLDQINQTLDSMDQLLKKNKYESVSNKKSPPLTEAERMARLRDIVTEDWSDWLPDLSIGNAATAYGAYKVGQASKTGKAGAAPAPGAAPAGTAAKHPVWLIKLNQGLSKAWSLAKTGTKWGLMLAAGAAMLALLNSFKENPDAAKASGLTVEDMQEFEQSYAQLQQLINDEAAFNALPPEVQQKATAIANRALKMAAGIANRKALEP